METSIASQTVSNPANMQQCLFVGRSLDFQLITDQALTKLFTGTNYIITAVYAVRKTGGASVACLGGIYTATAKGGSALVAVGQSWVSLAVNVQVPATLAITTAILSATPLYVSLSTGSTTAVTADVFVFGVIID